MYKNNKILKAAAGAPLVLAGIPAAGPLALFGGLTALGIYNATHPHASSTHMQDLQAQLEGELRDGFEVYKAKQARKYQEKLANGEYVTPSGTHITSYNPETMELSGYKIADNGDIVYNTKNVYTGEFGPSVYYDANTRAHYEGINTPYINTIEVSKGENLMPWSIIPTTTPAELTFDNTIVAAPLEGLYVAKEKNKSEDNAKPEETIKPEETPEPEEPNDSWWKRIFGRNSKGNSPKESRGFDQTFRLDQPFNWYNAGAQITGHTLKSLPTIGVISTLSELLTRPLVNSGRIEKTPIEYLLDLYIPKEKQTQPEPVKQEQSEPTYDNANLKEMVKQRDERQSKIDSLNNAR